MLRECVELFGVEEQRQEVGVLIDRGSGWIGDGKGSALGQFNYPNCMALLMPSKPGDNPLLYVSDFYNDRVQVFDATTGQVVRSIGNGQGSELGSLDGPHGLVLQLPSRSGDSPLLYVSDTNNHRVLVFDAITGRAIRNIGNNAGSNFGSLSQPRGLALQLPSRSGDDPLLYVSDFDNDLVQVFNVTTGLVTRSIDDDQGSELGHLLGPEGLALQLPSRPGDNPLLYVADTCNHRIQVFDAITGLAIRSMGNGKGTALGQLQDPLGVALQLPSRSSDRALLYVADLRNHRIQVFDAVTGEALRELPVGDEAHGGEVGPFGVIVHREPDGSSLLFVSCSNGRVQVMAL
jgi:DNA-binding beta-propeller fold protein YncE